MRFFDKKDISLADEIKRVITNRILLSLFILFLGILALGILNVSSTFTQLRKNVQGQCAILNEFTISQLLINNENAVKLNLNKINAKNKLIHFSWIKKPLLQRKQTEILWLFPFSWTEYCPIRSQDGEQFGYFKVTGSLFYNGDLLSEILMKIGLAISFCLVIFLLLHPLSKRIPERLFIRPVMQLLQLLKSGSNNAFEVDNYQIPIEIQEIKLKLIQMLNEAELHSHEVAFGQIAAKVAHDIRSPLAALNMLLKKNAASLPEEERNIIRSATQRINDIANNLLNQKKAQNLKNSSENFVVTPKKTEPQLVAILLENIISEKRAQYSERDIQFKLHIDENLYGVFVNVNADELSRALSNLINNAVEAIAEKGTVTLTLSKIQEKSLLFSLSDTGKGMLPEQLSEVLKHRISLKENGSGIGLYSAIQSIESWNGVFSIKSQFGEGTQVNFILPMADHPDWFVSVLMLPERATIVFLDDDEVIHQIWKKRLNEIENSETFDMIHCHRSDELIKWYNDHPVEREKAIFLVDYELIGSSLTGSEVIKQLNIVKRSLIVTSRYDEANLRLESQQLGIKAIPKSFAVHIPIRVFCSHPDFIFIDDSVYLTDAWKAQAALNGKKAIIFNSITEVNHMIDYFSKDTPLYIDSNLGDRMKGEDLAKMLYDKGFTTIYLCTGMDESEFQDMPWIKKIIGKEYPEDL